MTSVLLAAYRDGRLEISRTFRSPESLSLTFSGAGERVVYALVNMASVREDELPEREDDLSQLTWHIGSYAAMDRDGLPMAGVVRTGPGAGSCPIPVTRLVSRFEFHLLEGYESFFTVLERLSGHSTDPGYLLKNIRYSLRNINGALRPFGTSVAGPSDLLQDEEFQLTEDGTAVLYVPENCQGLLLKNADPARKDLPALLAQYGSGYTVCASYVEVSLTHDPSLYGVGGDLTYRFFLGEDATSDFTIRRNRIYTVGFGPTYDTVMRCYDTGSWPWKVESANWHDSRYLAFGVEQLSVRKGAQAVLPLRYGFEGEDRPAYSGDWTLLAKGAGETDASLVPAGAWPAFSSVSFDAGRSEVLLGLSAVAAAGQAVELVARTTDGRHEARARLQILPDGELTVTWDHEPRYIGQTGDLSARREGSPVAWADVRAEEGSDRVRVQVEGGACRVSALRSGPVRLVLTTQDGDSETVSLTVKAPVLQADPMLLTLPADASSAPQVRLSYRSDEADGRVPLAVGGSGAWSLDADLYERYLQPQLSAGTGPLSHWLALDGDRVYVAAYPSDPDDLLGVRDDAALTAGPVLCPDVACVAVGAQVPALFSGKDAATRLGSVYNYSVPGVFASSQRASETFVVYDGTRVEWTQGPSFVASVPATSWSFEDYGQFSFAVTAAGKLVVSPGASGWTAGRVPLTARLRNVKTGATLRVPAGQLDCYLFTWLGGIYRGGAVSADLWGSSEVPAFRALRNVLLTAASIRPDFAGRAFVLRSSSGNRVWTLPTEESLDGSFQINYETDAFRMSTWTEAKGPTAVYRLGETVYRVSLNTEMATVYDYSWEYLMDSRLTKTYLTCSVAAQSSLSSSALGWHYAYGTERDDAGRSYYVFSENVPYFQDTDASHMW